MENNKRQSKITDYFGNGDSRITSLNMATTPMNLGNLNPVMFDGEDVDGFIEDFERFAKVLDIADDKKVYVVMAYMSKEMQPVYERSKGANYKQKLKNAFGKEETILDVMKDALSLRLGNHKPEVIFEKIDNLIDKLTRKKFGKKELTELFYQNIIDDAEIKKEVILRGAKEKEEVKDIIKKMNRIKDSKTEVSMLTNTNAWRTVKPKPYNNRRAHENDERRKIYNNRRNDSQFNRYPITDRNLEQKNNTIQCWACLEKGHIRRDCPKIQCSFCRKRGHLRTQCYQNPGRFNERRQSRLGYPQNYDRRIPFQQMDEEKEINDANKDRSHESNNDIENMSGSGNELAQSLGEVINVLN